MGHDVGHGVGGQGGLALGGVVGLGDGLQLDGGIGGFLDGLEHRRVNVHLLLAGLAGHPLDGQAILKPQAAALGGFGGSTGKGQHGQGHDDGCDQGYQFPCLHG